MKILITRTLLFTLFLACFNGNLKADDLIDNANKGLNYLIKNVINKDLDQFPEAETLDAIQSLSIALNNVELTNESVLLLKRARVYATHSINNKRLYENKPVDVSLAMQAIDDVDDILKAGPNDDNASLLYSAGHIALHQVKDTRMAYDYWNRCAEMGHAGCMNTIAAESFTGMNGLQIDINNSIRWHKRVFATGIKFNCAGAFSANMLSNMSFFFPQFKTGGDWKYWRDQREALIAELEMNPDNANLCPRYSFFLQDYTFEIGSGGEGTEVLGKAISAAEEKSVIDVLKLINNTDLSEALNRVNRVINDYQKCDLTFNLLMQSRYQNDIEMAKKAEDYFFTLDRVSCSDQIAIIQRLRDEGRW